MVEAITGTDSGDNSLQTGTTIEQFVGLVNAQAGATNVRASYDETTGELQIEGLGFGNAGVTVTSDDLSGGGVGLLDGDSASAVNTFHNRRQIRLLMSAMLTSKASTQTVTLVKITTGRWRVLQQLMAHFPYWYVVTILGSMVLLSLTIRR